MRDDTARLDVLTRARDLRGGGASYEAIAALLSTEGYPTARGGQWASQSVWRLLNRKQPNAARLVTCDCCGQLTAAKDGVCARRACKRAYGQRTRDLLPPQAPEATQAPQTAPDSQAAPGCTASSAVYALFAVRPAD